MDAKTWAAIWKNNRKLLQDIHDQEVAQIDTAKALRNLAPAFEYARRNAPVRLTSGLVEFQSLIRRMPR